MARVLVIEDELTIRNLLQQVLADAGHEVDSAADCLSAMEQR